MEKLPEEDDDGSPAPAVVDDDLEFLGVLGLVFLFLGSDSITAVLDLFPHMDTQTDW